MKMSIKDITIAACGAFAAIVLTINWLVPVNAQTPGQQMPRQLADLQSIALDKQGFVAAAQHVLVGVDQMLQELTVSRANVETLTKQLADETKQLADEKVKSKQLADDFDKKLTENVKLKDDLAKARAMTAPAPVAMPPAQSEMPPAPTPAPMPQAK